MSPAARPGRSIASTARATTPLLRADPAGVHGRDHAGARVGHQHRHTIGRHHRQGQSRRSWSPIRRCRRTAPHCGSSTTTTRSPCTWFIQTTRSAARPMRVGQPGAVGGDRRRVVADMVAQVEGVERRRRDAARAGGGHPPDANAHVPSIRTAAPRRHGRGRLSRAQCNAQWRMKGGTSTSSSSPPMLTVAPLVCTGTLTASTGSNSGRGHLAGLRRLDPVCTAGLRRRRGLRPGPRRRSRPRSR